MESHFDKKATHNKPPPESLLLFLYILTALFMFHNFNTLTAQTYSPAQMKTAFVYNFMKYVEWSDEEDFSAFIIGLYGSDKDLYKNLEAASSQGMIREKSLRIVQVSDLKEAKSVHLLMVTESENANIRRIANFIRQTNTLLITDHCDDKPSIMINFVYPAENRIEFEVNKSNIVFEGLKLSPDILLLGGSELDVRLLYREVEATLQQTQETVALQRTELEQQLTEIQKHNEEIEKLNTRISNQNDQVLLKDKEIQDKELKLSQLESTLIEQQSLFKERFIVSQQREQDITKLEKEIEANQDILESQRVEIEKQALHLEEEEQRVRVQTSTIEAQRGILLIGMLVLVVVLVLVAVIYWSYKKWRRAEKVSRKNAESLSEAIERLDFALNSAKMGNWVYYIQENRFEADSTTEQIFGMEPGDFDGKYETWQSFIHPDDKERVEALLEASKISGESIEDEYQIILRNGDVRYVSNRGIFILDSEGTAVRGTGLIWDITRQKIAEAEIIESKNRTDAILKASTNGIITINEKGIIESFNPVAEQIFGYKNKEIIGKNVKILMPDEHATKHDKYINNYIETGEKHSIGKRLERMAKRKNGTSFPMEIGISEVNLKDSRLFMAIVNDITERKKAEEDVRRLSVAVEQSSASIVITNMDGTIEYVNPKFSEVTGYSYEEAIGRKPKVLRSGDQSKEFHEELWSTILSGNEWHGEISNKKKNGDIYWESASISPLQNDAGKITHFIAVLEDITDKHNIQMILAEAKETAEAATQAKSDFLANMSHEIRTPMNAVLGLNYLLLKTELNTKQRDYASKIGQSAENLLGIINDILDFSKIEAGKLDIESIAFDLDDVLSNLSNLVGVKAQEKELELIFARNTNVPIGLIGDPIRLGQVLLNLSTNAIKFTDEGEITVGVELIKKTTRKAIVKFYVKDSGIGLTKKQRAKLFQSFQQADASTTRKYGGTGLGLIISKSLVEKMHGQINVDSKPGEGSTFHFTAEFGLPKKQIRKKRIVPEHLVGMRVLVVDDHETAQEVLKSYCEDFQLVVDTAINGEIAVKAILKAVSESNPYRLIFMDWKLPGISGTEIAVNIFNDPKIKIKPKIIMVTSFGREEIRQKAEQVGIDTFLIKPVNQSLLFDSIAEVFGEEIEREERRDLTVVKPEKLDYIRGAQILLAEDNEINQQVAIELLESEGFQVTLAENGEEAVKAIKDTDDPFDLVLMDLQMPVMDGYEACRTIRKKKSFKELPILAMTADAMSGIREKTEEAGMNDFITKPIDVGELFKMLTKWIKPKLGKAKKKSRTTVQPKIKTKISSLMKLDGIDIDLGLKRVAGNVDLYHKILFQFSENNERVIDETRRALIDGEQELAERLVHTLKGVSGNLGAKDLHESAKTLEAIIKNPKQSKDDLEEAFINTSQVLKASLNAINKYENQVKKDTPPEKGKDVHDSESIDRDGAIKIIKTMSDQLSEYSTDAVNSLETLRNMIDTGVYSPILIEVKKALDKFDFNSAKTKTEQLLQEFEKDQNQ